MLKEKEVSLLLKFISKRHSINRIKKFFEGQARKAFVDWHGYLHDFEQMIPYKFG